MIARSEIPPDKYYNGTAMAANHASIRIFGEITLDLEFNGL